MPRKVLLLVASLVFYLFSGAVGLLVLFVSGALSYLLAHGITRAKTAGKKRALLGIGCGVLVLTLLSYKYLSPLLGLTSLGQEQVRSTLSLLVCLGISFYVFQLLVFLVEVYRGQDTPSAPLDFAVFLLFFPYRTMGPIATHRQVCEQLSDPQALTVSTDEVARGVYQFVLGLAKKLLLADSIAVMANNGFALEGELALLPAWGAALAYTFQLYFDFSGYSDMAIGAARIFGVRLPQNFDSPYRSESVSVFWRRWHMTLGNALTRCVYISLGGNRRGTARTCLNLFLVMLVSGLWHGSTYNFLLWGAAYGLILAFERLAMPYLERVPTWLRRAFTFLTVTFLWVPFRAADMDSALRVWRGMVNLRALGLSTFGSLSKDGVLGAPAIVDLALSVGLILLCAAIAFFCKNSHEKTEKLKPTGATVFFCAVLFCLCVVHLSKAGVFLYENF